MMPHSPTSSALGQKGGLRRGGGGGLDRTEEPYSPGTDLRLISIYLNVIPN